MNYYEHHLGDYAAATGGYLTNDAHCGGLVDR